MWNASPVLKVMFSTVPLEDALAGTPTCVITVLFDVEPEDAGPSETDTISEPSVILKSSVFHDLVHLQVIYKL